MMTRLLTALVLWCALAGSAAAQINYPALKTELQQDPTAVGYATSVASGNDVATAALLNTARAGITIRRGDISAIEISNAINVADYTALPATPTNAQLSTERRYLAWITGVMTVGSVRLLNDDGTDASAITNFRAMFAGGTGTLTRLLALAIRSGTRAEQLFGIGTTITAADIAKALR